ncbi:MAG: (5-formylfuran-3-yl)methyl phosphate synthase, partial [Chloroflexota bacterium]
APLAEVPRRRDSDEHGNSLPKSPAVLAFLADIEAVYRKHGMSISHEDGHGGFIIEDLDELARINPDIVGVRGAVCSSGERDRAVAWEAVAEFKRQVDLRKSGALSVHKEPARSNGAKGWVVIDGRGKSCAGIIAALTQQVATDGASIVEAILGDALNIYDVMVWVEKSGHGLLTRRVDSDGSVRVLIQPGAAVASGGKGHVRT